MSRRRRPPAVTFDCGSRDFVDAVHGYMEELCYDVNDDVIEAAGDSGTKAAQLLRERSRRESGAYAKDWVADARPSATGVDVTVHNKDHYQLTHLLEKGHAVANQYGEYRGRVEGDGVIADVADETAADFMGRFQR